mgnify:CR=1 FL=1
MTKKFHRCSYSVSGELLEEIREKLVNAGSSLTTRLDNDAKQILSGLVWTTDDIPSFECLADCDMRIADMLDKEMGAEKITNRLKYLDGCQFDYATETVNNSIIETSIDLVLQEDE